MIRLDSLTSGEWVEMISGWRMRFAESRPWVAVAEGRAPAPDMVSGGWWLAPEVLARLNEGVRKRGSEIADWMRAHPAEVDALFSFSRPPRADWQHPHII